MNIAFYLISVFSIGIAMHAVRKATSQKWDISRLQRDNKLLKDAIIGLGKTLNRDVRIYHGLEEISVYTENWDKERVFAKAEDFSLLLKHLNLKCIEEPAKPSEKKIIKTK